MSEQRKHDIEITIDAPPELVWQAITEGAGLTRWFAPDAKVELGEGGSIYLSWGPGMEGTAPITIWEPGRRVGWTEQGSGPPRVVEFLLEGSGGRTKLRLVHSGFGAEASFDAEYESTHGGWHTFLAMLRHGLERHPATPAKNVTGMRMSTLAHDELWGRVRDAMGLAHEPVEGGRVRVLLGDSTIDGVVFRVARLGYACIDVDQWDGSILSLFAERCGGASVLTVTAILFGDQAGREAEVRAAIDKLLSVAG
jgi:uncharacterized protein YndB with AHSA1/START domain